MSIEYLRVSSEVIRIKYNSWTARVMSERCTINRTLVGSIRWDIECLTTFSSHRETESK